MIGHIFEMADMLIKASVVDQKNIPDGMFFVIVDGIKIHETKVEQEAHDKCPTGGIILSNKSIYGYYSNS